MDQSNRGDVDTTVDSRDCNDSNENNDIDREWQIICQLAVASASATATLWLQVTAAGIALHKAQLKSTPASRASARRSPKKMLTPKRGKFQDVESTDRSPKNFRWSQHYEDTLLDLLVREARKGNRPESTFTATAFRTVVKEFNMIHNTNITKKHVQSRIKTMKIHFYLFHGAFNGLSGFAWNPERKMFEAEDYVWDERIKDNTNLGKLRDKACHNWDKLYELYGDTRAKGNVSTGLKEKTKKISRGLAFRDLRIETEDLSGADNDTYECSSYGDHEFSKDTPNPPHTPEYIPTQLSEGSSHSKHKRKASMISTMEDGYKTVAASIDKLSMAISTSCKPNVHLNEELYKALASLGLHDEYRVRCYSYLCANPPKAASLVAAPDDIRAILLENIMKEHRIG